MRSLWVLGKRVHSTLCYLVGTLNGSPFPSPVSTAIMLGEYYSAVPEPDKKSNNVPIPVLIHGCLYVNEY
jgi:hypothetical protein